jgi:Family of unknown function (DUF5313)
MVRPDPPRWIWYTFGGRLGPRYSQWVLRDTTSRTRWLRQAVRAVTQVTLPAAVVLTLLGLGIIAWGGVLLGGLLALWYSLAYIDQTGERRLVKHGHAPGALKRALRERDRVENDRRDARYAQMYRAA